MLKRLAFLSLVILAFVACQKDVKKTHDKSKIEKTAIQGQTLFEDNQLRQIFTYINTRNKTAITKYLSSTNPTYRAYTLRALASIADTSDIYRVSLMLQDTNEAVREAAVYYLGHTGKKEVQDYLIKHFYNESSPKVRALILEQLGNCGDSRALYVLANMYLSPSDTLEVEGIARGLANFSLRGITSDLATRQVIKILTTNDYSSNLKTLASYYLLSHKVNLRPYISKLIGILEQTNSKYFKINLLHILARQKTYQAQVIVRSNLQSRDLLVRRAAFESLLYNKRFDEGELIRYLNDTDPVVAAMAANYFVYYGTDKKAQDYFNIAKLVRNWQARSLMFHAALKYADDSLRPIIVRSIIYGYKAAANQYEKANLLMALAYDPLQYAFVKDQTFYSTNKVISTAGIKTLVRMRYNPHFAKFAKQYAEQQNDNLYQEFGLIFKEAMLKGDNAMIFYAANTLKNRRLRLIKSFDNVFFIKQALTKLKLPRDIRVYRSVCKLLAIYQGDSCQTKNVPLSPINWSVLDKFSLAPQVVVKTTKGQFIITLDVKNAPVTVATFLKLVLDNYYDNVYVYRLVPNKSVMISSRRGDGWVDENIANGVFLSGKHFEPGTVAMQLVDKNVESIQWLVTLTDMPQLNGKLAPFGKVTKGLDVVEKLQPGDKILAVDIYKAH